MHAAQAPPSSRHWKVEPASVAEKPSEALVEEVVPDGPEPMLVSGGVVSTALATVTAMSALRLLPAAS